MVVISSMRSPEPFFSALVVAGGTGTRFSAVESKTTKKLFGKPVVEYSLNAFQACSSVSEIVLVGDAGSSLSELTQRYPKLIAQIAGGKTRSDSVSNGLQSIHPSTSFLFIHDAARPLVTSTFLDQMADQIVNRSDLTGIYPILPLYDALKSLDVADCPVSYEGSPLYRTQTPQLFAFPILKQTMEKRKEISYRDEIQMIQQHDQSARFLPIPGCYQLEKITTLREWCLLEHLFPKEQLIGIGYDFHYFIPGKPLVLGGIRLPEHDGLEGDSDGDVLTHSLLEAFLGALSLGDMGTFFGIGTPEVTGRQSTEFLHRLLRHAGFQGVQIWHIDTTVVCKTPSLQKWIPTIQKNISHHLSISEKQINIKSTTDKGMDAAGEGKGIRCITVALLERIRRDYAR